MDIFAPIIKAVWKDVDKSDKKRIAAQTPPQGLTCICDLNYMGDNQKEHLLDIYYPERTTEKLPVIIDIHGGGWTYGYKEINKNYCLTLAKKGFVVASINYRLADKVFFADQIRDIFAAFSYLFENLEKYHGDNENVFLVGDSAGGHFACVCAAIETNKEYQKDFGVKKSGLEFKAVGAVSPAVNLTGDNFMLRANLKMLLGEDYKNSKFYKYMNFDKIASYKLPDFYIVTSDGDSLLDQAYELCAILSKYNVNYMVETYTKRIYGEKLPHVFSVAYPFKEASEEAIENLTKFFKARMKQSVKF